MVVVYCTLCGNRALPSAGTGEPAEAPMALPEAFLEMLPDLHCRYCGGSMAAKEIGAP
jgi:hypothetical protein